MAKFRKNLIVLGLTLLCTTQYSFSQKICSCCYDSLKARRVVIVGEKLYTTPYSSIVNLFVNSKDFRGSATILSNNLILTAKHNLTGYAKPKTLFLYINQPQGDTLIQLKKKDYQIILCNDKSNKIANDIAMIKIKDVNKLKNLTISKFEIEDFELLKPKIIDTIHITGFPCDMETVTTSDKIVQDTLTDKFVLSSHDLQIDSNNTIMGFDVCACFGDSGGPIWTRINEKNYLIGVIHGLSNVIDDRKILRVGVILTKEKIDWIIKHLKPH